jgi:uncharacterized protein (TIGR02284 family)
MSDNKPHIIKDLLQVLEDGKDGFAKAAESVKDHQYKTLFSGFSAERQEMIDELVAYSTADHDDAQSTVTGALHRGWINLKAALTSGDDHAVLAECERGEDHAVSEFRKALEEDLPAEARSTVESISTRILAVHNQVRDLRDQAKAAS